MNFLFGLLFGWFLGERTSKVPLPVPGKVPVPPGPVPPMPGGWFPPIPAGWPFPGGEQPPGGQPVPPTPGGNDFPFPVPPMPGGSPPGGGEIPPVFKVPPGGGIPPVFWKPPPGGGIPSGQPPQKTTYAYKIKSGDYASGLAKKGTGDGGRWREILDSNPEMSTYTDSNGSTQIKPWNVGQVFVVPPGWNLPGMY